MGYRAAAVPFKDVGELAQLLQPNLNHEYELAQKLSAAAAAVNAESAAAAVAGKRANEALGGCCPSMAFSLARCPPAARVETQIGAEPSGRAHSQLSPAGCGHHWRLGQLSGTPLPSVSPTGRPRTRTPIWGKI